MASRNVNTLLDLIIFQEEDGTYNLFGKYIITPKSSFEYVVTSTTSYLCASFASLRNATAWCIMDKREKLYEARRVQEIDLALSGFDIGIAQHQKLLKKAKTSDNQLVYFAKLTDDRLKKKKLTDELNGYIQNTKTWQTKRYAQ
jgi:hypothetical protein